MNEQQFQNSLKSLAIAAFPNDGQAWRKIQQRMLQEAIPTKPPRFRWSVVLASVVIVMVVVLAFTPAGEALAKILLSFTSVPVSTPSPLDICYEDPWGYACKILQEEKRSGFDAKEFPGELENFQLRDIPVANSDTFVMEYTYRSQGGGFLYFRQSTDTDYNSYAAQVPEDTIVEEVWVGESRGEFVRGRYNFWGMPTTYIWKEDLGARLQWSDGEYWYEIDVFSMLGVHEQYNESAYLVALALSLVDESTEIRQLRLQYLTSLEEINKISSFDVLKASILPDDFTFSYGSYDETSPRLILHYAPENQTQLAELLITETPLENLMQQEKPEGKIVWINGHIGRYTSSSAYSHSVTWETDGMQIIISLNVSEEDYGIGFTKKEFLEIARGLE